MENCINRLVKSDNNTIIIESLFETIKNSMIEGKNVYFRGFGSFVNKKKGKVVSPFLKESLPEYYAPVFKPARDFKKLIKDSNVPSKRMVTKHEKKISYEEVKRKQFEKILNR